MIPGVVPDASIGEACHQPRKRTVTSGSGRDIAAHSIRSENTRLALRGLAEGIPYKATMYNRRTRKKERVEVTAGEGCSAVLQELLPRLDDGLREDRQTSVTESPSVEKTNPRHIGAATWTLTLGNGEAPSFEGPCASWEEGIRRGGYRVVPSHQGLRAALCLWYGCGEEDEGDCGNIFCQQCSPEESLQDQVVDCSRYVSGASPGSSSSTRRWRGGAVRTAGANVDRPLEWAFGAGGGEDVEIYTSPQHQENTATASPGVTLGRILYFFDHSIGGQHLSLDERPLTSWVVVAEFVSQNPGNGGRLSDAATNHPVFRLRTESHCKIFPTSAIKRHVHMRHVCPGLGASSQWKCTYPEKGASVHRFKAAALGAGHDEYLLNEFHHSMARDSDLT